MAGRPPDAGQTRTVYLRVRLAEYEARHLDDARGAHSRSEYVRDLIASDAREKGIAT